MDGNKGIPHWKPHYNENIIRRQLEARVERSWDCSTGTPVLGVLPLLPGLGTIGQEP